MRGTPRCSKGREVQGEWCEAGAGGQGGKGKGEKGVETQAYSAADGPEQSWGYP